MSNIKIPHASNDFVLEWGEQQPFPEIHLSFWDKTLIALCWPIVKYYRWLYRGKRKALPRLLKRAPFDMHKMIRKQVQKAHEDTILELLDKAIREQTAKFKL